MTRKALSVVGLVAACLLSSPARGAAAPGALERAAAQVERPHAVYLELLGKAGVYSVGYDYLFRRWLGAGGALSYYRIEEQDVVCLAAYANLYPYTWGRHALLLQPGLMLVHISLGSAVEGWSGASTTDLGGLLSLGHEYRRGVLLRSVITLSFGKNGLAPWLGLAVGWSI